MRRFPLYLVLLAATLSASAQVTVPRIPGVPLDTSLVGLFDPVSQISAGLGLTTIDGGDEDGEFLLLGLDPEFDLGAIGVPQVGMGLSAGLRFQVGGGEDGSGFSFRQEDYDETSEILSILRYVRYGRKQGTEALYARFGAIDFGQVGYGSLVEAYRNEVGQDGRTRGGAFDLDVSGVGVETLYGDFATPGVYAGRAYVRPLRFFNRETASDLTLGVTIAGDLNPEGGFVNTDAPGQPFFLGTTPEGAPTATGATGVDDRGALQVYGVDLGIRLTGSDLYQVGLYADATHFSGYGTGGSGGVLLTLTPAGSLTRINARAAVIFEGEGYQPTYFNSFYEVERLVKVDSTMNPATGERQARFQTRRNRLAGSTEAGGGGLAQVSAIFAGFIRMEGRYQHSFVNGEGGWLHLGADVRLPGGIAFLRAGLDRWNIGGNAPDVDEQEGDYRMSAEAGIQPLPNLMIGFTAERAFAPEYADGEVVDLLRQDRLEPIVRFVLPIGPMLGGQ